MWGSCRSGWECSGCRAGGRSGRGRTAAPPSALFVAGLIALGIGLHNFGEGLAIGAAFALGEAALGSFLVVGFTLHNITEGVRIAAPLTREQATIRRTAGLALLGGSSVVPWQ